ncbi:hypothetical protein DLAC_10420 [Tieghemostelium lacteum]|uniref:Leucine-rich repeat-containing protein (LRR) n=1 Tax=Tieghemostelium lacteum TaxID=361077 RepID=A0A151Z5G3_TIELA|nr:hypothetical protein DLAC_10420 [Tieghemostelium lacteum]|eukprot:KYQ89175.1 hypothetical protein DLAC_10420 [Tieghemostelium lacteum]
MDELRELRRKMHESYLEKKKQDEESGASSNNIVENITQPPQPLVFQSNQFNEVNQLIPQENEQIEHNIQNEEEQQVHIEQQQQLNEEIEDDISENEDQEDENDNNIQNEEEQPPLPIFGMPGMPGGMPGMPFGMNPNMMMGGMFHQPFQAFQGSGNQLSSKEYFGPNPSLEPEETSESIRQKHAVLIESRLANKVVIDDSKGNISPPISSKQEKLLQHKKLVMKSLVEMCLNKLIIDLQTNQMKLKLLSPDLIHRLIETMNKTGKMTKTRLNQMVVGGAKICELNLSHQYHMVNNDFLLNSLPYMVYVTKINFGNCGNITDVGMEVFRKLKNLTVLDLRDNKVTDVGIRNIKNLVHLEELYLRNTLISDKGVAFFDALNQLNTLDLSKTKITDQSMLMVSGFLKLQHLFLAETAVSDKGIQQIIKLPLMQLNLSNCVNITNQGLFFITYFGETLRILDLFQTKIFGAGLVNFKKLSKLQSITLPGRDGFTDQSVVHLNNLVNIRKLDLNDYIHLTSIVPLTNVINLVELHLSNTKITDDSLQVVKSMTLLEILSLDRTLITDAAIPLISKLSLITLSLMSTKISGECLKDLSGISTLQNLNISFNNIDDKNMEYLTQLHDLLYLDLRGTNTFKSLNIFADKLQIRPPVVDPPTMPVNPHAGWNGGGGEEEDEEFDENEE